MCCFAVADLLLLLRCAALLTAGGVACSFYRAKIKAWDSSSSKHTLEFPDFPKYPDETHDLLSETVAWKAECMTASSDDPAWKEPFRVRSSSGTVLGHTMQPGLILRYYEVLREAQCAAGTALRTVFVFDLLAMDADGMSKGYRDFALRSMASALET